MKGKLLAEIKKKLSEGKICTKIEVDAGQVEEIDTNTDKSVTLPNSVFISFSQINYKNTEVKGVQDGDLLITVKCLSKSIDRGVLDFDFVENVFLALQDFEGSFFTFFNRVSEPETFYKLAYTVSSIVFETTITDDRAFNKEQERYEKVSPTLKVEKSNE